MSFCSEIYAKNHPKAEAITPSWDDSEIKASVEKGNLSHKDLLKPNGIEKNTGLHYAAKIARPEVLKHPDVGYVENGFGTTPLHVYAKSAGSGSFPHNEFLKHPDVDKVKNEAGHTPLDIYMQNAHPSELKARLTASAK